MRQDDKRGKNRPPRSDKRPFKGKPKKWDKDARSDRDKPRDDKWRKDKSSKPFKKRDDRDRKSADGRDFKKRDFDNKKRFDRPRYDAPRDDKAPREERGPRPSLYGFHACREAWLNEARTIKTLFLTEQAEEDFAPVMKEAYEQGLKRPSITTVEKHTLDRMLPRGAVHQGIALIAERLDEASIQDFIIKSKGQDKTVLLMLDQVTDPHNVGAILRSACAFGADGVIMQRKHAPELEGALAKSASGAVEHVAVAYETNLSRTLEELKENEFFVFGLDERGEREVGDIMRNNTKGNHKIVLVLGAEGDGMRRLVKENCDELVKLPTSGALSSLNVSNAAAVALYALCK